MDVNIRAINAQLSGRFEDYVESKTEKIQTLLPKTQSFEVRVSCVNDKSPKHGDRVEITIIGPGPVVRAEANSGDNFSAFDIAYGKILERVRRMKDKRKVDHKRGLTSLGEAAAADFSKIDITPADASVFSPVSAEELAEAGSGEHGGDYGGEQEAQSPVVIRSKSFPSETMTVEQAVDRMELVGHDFFLFVDAATDKPSVVYRRKGWNYGVISLEDSEE